MTRPFRPLSRLFWLALLVAFLALQTPSTTALGAPSSEGESVTLAVALERTMKSNPTIQAATWAIREAEGGVTQAGLWPNPELGLEYEDFGLTRPWLTDGDVTISVHQAFPLSNRITAARDAARIRVKRHGVMKELNVLDAVAGLRQEFVVALGARERTVLASQALELAESMRELVLARVEAGDLPESQLDPLDAEVVMARLELDGARRESAIAASRLASWWGDDARAMTVEGTLHQPDQLLASLPDSALPSKSPRVQVYEQMAREARAIRDLEDASATPDLNLGLGYRGISSFDESALVVSFSIPLPLVDRNQGRRDSARAAQRRVEFEAQAGGAEIMRAIFEARQRLEGATQRWQMVHQELRPAMQRSVESARLGFQAGELGTLALLEAKRALMKASRLELEALVEANLAWIRWNKMAGNLDALMSPSIAATQTGVSE